MNSFYSLWRGNQSAHWKDRERLTFLGFFIGLGVEGTSSSTAARFFALVRAVVDRVVRDDIREPEVAGWSVEEGGRWLVDRAAALAPRPRGLPAMARASSGGLEQHMDYDYSLYTVIRRGHE